MVDLNDKERADIRDVAGLTTQIMHILSGNELSTIYTALTYAFALASYEAVQDQDGFIMQIAESIAESMDMFKEHGSPFETRFTLSNKSTSLQ